MAARRDRVAAVLDAAAGAAAPVNPWAPADVLSNLLFPDVAPTAVTRARAMSVPTVARARNLVTSTVAGAPITEHTADGRRVDPPRTLLAQPDPDVPRGVTLAWTVDDLMFYGVAYWAVLERAADVTNGNRPLHARRVDPLTVDLDDLGRPRAIGGADVDPRDVITFPGLHEGVLSFGATELRTAVALQDAARRFSSVPLPALVLHDQSEDGLTPAARAELVADWNRARAAGTVAYANRSLNVESHGWSSRELQLVEARQHSAAEVARIMLTPAAMVDAAVSGSSVTYANLNDSRRDLADYTLSTYTAPIEQRLSMDDLTERGRFVAFDLDSTILRGSFADRMAAYVDAAGTGVYTLEELRALERGRAGTVAP